MITQADVDLANAAIVQKLLSKEEATECFRQLKGLEQAGKSKTFAAYLLDKGVLSQAQIDSLASRPTLRATPEATPAPTVESPPEGTGRKPPVPPGDP